MLINIPERKRYLDDKAFQSAMRIWHEEETAREANLSKPLKEKVSDALMPNMISALSERQLRIIERMVDKDVDEWGNKITPDMILGSYELVVTLIYPEPATDKYASPSLHFP